MFHLKPIFNGLGRELTNKLVEKTIGGFICSLFNVSQTPINFFLEFSVGTSVEDQLQYLYENHNEFAALPTFVVGPALQAAIIEIGKWPGKFLFSFYFLFPFIAFVNLWNFNLLINIPKFLRFL